MSKYDSLNDMQRKAVYKTEGPVLVLAGAGSGKTRVLTHRIAYLIEEKDVNPWNILAITFTNKAAGEMRERVDNIVGFGAESIWVSTFHSTCVRILRRYIDKIGYDTNFSIYDGDDQKVVMREVCKRLKIDTKMFKEKAILKEISSAKDNLITPVRFELEAGDDYREKTISKAYREYQETLRKNNALDFDDLIVKTIELFRNCPDVLEYYQNRFQYIMVDEYQDTNTAQFELVHLLAKKYRNLCVVGDDDQSIYKFRGANIKNILNFEDAFEDATVIKLEQNYRSSQNILDAANNVIKNNRGRKDKALWTQAGAGEKITFVQTPDAYTEGEYVAGKIKEGVREGTTYSQYACLYRTNAQSRALEEKFLLSNIPYKIVGGQNFYQRKEIKDILAYLKTVDNGRDDVAVKRIINVPKRGIGATTIQKIDDFATSCAMSFYEALEIADEIPGLGRAAIKIKGFTDFVQVMRRKAETLSVKELMEEILDSTGYIKELELENTPEAMAKIDNIEEFYSKAVDYEESSENPTLSGFLEEVALVADIDSLEEESDYVVLMTIHSAKGLEFDTVFLTGMEDGLFPGYGAITSDDPMEIEEERRLCYVAITRAKQKLYITAARSRMLRGETQYNNISRFIKEIPPLLLDTRGSLSQVGREIGVNKDRQSGSSYKFGGKDVAAGIKNMYSSKSNAGVTMGKNITTQNVSDLGYGLGDTVKHIKFGKGVVKDIKDGGRDFEVTVDFEKSGVRKMFASFAKLKKIQ
jgi:DNA helicase-2/ATP-dependent DNA helicase PcrA